MNLLYKLPKVIAIVGPTASGKTALSLKLAKKFNGEIISADSRQIYCEMDIGTAKAPISPATKAETGMSVLSNGIPHYLVNIKNPNQNYTLVQWKNDAQKAAQKILKKGKLPIVVGGTGLYIYALVNNLDIPEAKPNPKLRKKLEREFEKSGVSALYNRLINIDPEAAYIVDPKNPRRIIRALEIALTLKKPFSSTRTKGPALFDFSIIGRDLPPEKLKSQIDKRTDEMFAVGLVGEVKKLVRRYGPRRTAFDAIGYREIIDHFDKKISLEEARELIKKNTWHFAKRQYTWFKKLPVIWIKDQKKAEKEIKKFLTK